MPCNLCSLPEPPARKHDAELDSLLPERAFLIVNTRKNWINGTKITWAMQKGGAGDMASVIKAAAEWQNIAKGLILEKIDDWNSAMIRIAFPYNGSSSSFIGTDNLLVSKSPSMTDKLPTMKFGWGLTDSWGRQTARHEWGHALGFLHEHQNPLSGIVWDEKEVYRVFSGAPNYWSDAQIRSNILNKFAPEIIDGSEWDYNSVMHYPFDPFLIREPVEYYRKGLTPQINGFSKIDSERSKMFYPSLTGEEEDEPIPIEIRELNKGQILYLDGSSAGDEFHFKFNANKGECISVSMVGNVDAVLVLKDSSGNQIKADDDTGFSRNAKVTQWSRSAREYLIDLRIVWKASGSGVGIVRR